MKTTITPILGRVLCPDKEIEGDFKGQPNSTRWVFDVEHEFDLFKPHTEALAEIAEQEQKPKNALRVRNNGLKTTLELFHIQLAEHRTGRVIKPEIFSFSVGPMSESFYEAKPHIEVRNGLIHIVVRVSNGGGCKYRIAIDTIHSSSR